ncbi:MAG: hypothetical protein MUE40_09280 [Anaerolineae bacterium]|jgi:hypothetical protein|nr:hypothetical protein [Anaerolineae bacterium]
MNPDQFATPNLDTEQRGILIVAIIAALASVVVAVVDTSRFFHVYLIAFVFWAEVAMGCLGLVLLNNLVNGRWLYPVQRFAEAGARTMPLLLLAFVPVIFGLRELYPWFGATELEGGKAFFLQPAFFVGRSLFYLAVWSVLAYVLTGWSYQRDTADTAGLEGRSRTWSALGAVVFVLTTSLAAFDWTMSLTPEWFSSVYGWLSLARAGLTTMALLLLVLAFFWDRAPLKSIITAPIVKDMGSLLLVAFLAWGYLGITQFLVIWSANVSYNVSWYAPRVAGTWETFTLAFLLLHALLLVLLLLPNIKRSKGVLVVLALVVFLLRIMELYWVVMPGAMPQFQFQAWDLAPLLALGGLWLAVALYFLGQARLLPVHHPSLAHDAAESGHEAAASSS